MDLPMRIGSIAIAPIISISIVCLAGCSDNEAEALRKENAELRAQLTGGGKASTSANPAPAASAVYHGNGAVAWGGYAGAAAYFSNGAVAWGGYRGAAVYHPNGAVAWGGYRGAAVYHANGAVAWGGYAGSASYHSNGQVLQGGANGISLNLGDGIRLDVTTTSATINVYGTPLSAM